MVKLHKKILSISTKGYTDIVDITTPLKEFVVSCGLREGTAIVFVQGSTAGVSVIEYEPGLIKDFQNLLERLMPYGNSYHHHDRWGDDNGSSHLRATLLGPSLAIPIEGGELVLGTWQQVILIDFDTSPRTRKIYIQLWEG